MANIAAIASGDFSSAATWTGGVIPGSGDVAYSNTFTVTISDTRTVQAITNAAGTGITVGGTFSLLNGTNLTCTNANGVVQGAIATSCITTPGLGVGSSASVAASVTVGLGNASTVLHSTAGTVNWVGNLANPNGNTAYIYQLSGSGTANITGNIVGQSTAGTVTTVGVTGNGSMVITGSVTGGSGNGGGAQLTLASTGSLTITGTVTAANVLAVVNSGSGTLTVNGTCQSSSTAPAVSGGVAAQITRLSGPFLLGASGNINPVTAVSWRWAPTQIPTYYEVVASNGTTKRSLYTSDNMPVGGYPVPANVRSGTIYGPSSENTGTLAVPSPSAVSLGVATDNTVGTAILTAANVRTSVGLASANLDTQFSNIPANVWSALTSALSTAGSIGKLLVDNINATIGSRLPTSSYTAPLDAAGTRSAIGLASANLDAQLDAIPTASENADAVRTNLTPELNRIQNCSTVDTTAQTVQDAVSS